MSVTILTETGVQDTAIALHAFHEATERGFGTVIETECVIRSSLRRKDDLRSIAAHALAERSAARSRGLASSDRF